MKPANQKIIVIASAARMPYLCDAVGKRPGVMTRYATARRVQTEVKIKKLIWEGDQYHAQSLAAVDVRNVPKARRHSYRRPGLPGR
jgi:hypothetical protein